jgi:hypothetical protein
MQIDYVKISCKEDVHICRTNFAKKMEQNSHKKLAGGKCMENDCFFEDLEVRDVPLVEIDDFLKVLHLVYA